MYFVDRKKIEAQLCYLDNQIILLENQSNWNTLMEKAALERITHMMLEVVLDVGNSMIDGFIMRDPGSYEDIVDILEDEKVYSKRIATELKQLLLYRKKLVHDYLNIDHQELYDTFFTRVQALKEFIVAIHDYLLNELGPVTAFKN
ncbi:DUF86 domain-containing protein [Niallia nealsonii]|uniref:DUF86 domain-containing protein n=1 Tax=Niallia nealsonii TaxID=115979 RepID=A0A2N0Z260_9BACI|nr:DUF86 domain-containing protein [Niallia nealsonii]PKG23603.1 DUF86 domain-containing protein [Niallia nealsonii]